LIAAALEDVGALIGASMHPTLTPRNAVAAPDLCDAGAEAGTPPDLRSPPGRSLELLNPAIGLPPQVGSRDAVHVGRPLIRVPAYQTALRPASTEPTPPILMTVPGVGWLSTGTLTGAFPMRWPPTLVGPGGGASISLRAAGCALKNRSTHEATGGWPMTGIGHRAGTLSKGGP
jgi:hypothetical protein